MWFPPLVHLNGISVKFAEQVKYIGLLFYALSKDNNDSQKQMKPLSYVSNKSIKHIWSVLSCSLKTHCFVPYLAYANVCSPTVVHVHTVWYYMKHLWGIYNNAYYILKYIPNINVFPHINFYAFILRGASSPNFFFHTLQLSDARCNSLFSSSVECFCMRMTEWSSAGTVFLCFFTFSIVSVCYLTAALRSFGSLTLVTWNMLLKQTNR